jgi:hypothetical protein
MSELRFKIMPRYIDGIDQAPATARKTETAYIQHEEYAKSEGVLYVVGAEEEAEDTLLNDPAVTAVVDKIALAEELAAAVLEGME